MPSGIYTRTEEMKKNMSKAHIGNEKLIKSLTGNKHSEKHKENISKNNAKYWEGKSRSEDVKRDFINFSFPICALLIFFFISSVLV